MMLQLLADQSTELRKKGLKDVQMGYMYTNMDQANRHSQLLFLLSIAPLSLYAGCGSEDDGSADTSGQNPTTQSTSGNDMPSTTTAPNPTTSVGGDSDADDSAEGGDVMTTSEGVGTSGGAETTSGGEGGDESTSEGGSSEDSSDGGDDMGSGTTTGSEPCPFEMPPADVGEIMQGCIDFADKVNECDYGGNLSEECVENYQAYCQAYVNDANGGQTQACIDAYNALNSCYAGLTCAEFMDYNNSICYDQFYGAVMNECAAAISPMISRLGIRRRAH